MIQVNNLSKHFGEQVLFDSVSFQLGSRERVGLVGRNGSGKSTLFKVILNELTSDGGEITIPKGYKIGALEQHIHFTKKTVLEECTQVLNPDDFNEFEAEKILFGLGFSETDLEKDPKSFSGGYQIRINLTKVLLQKPDLLLLDEPTNDLDIVTLNVLESFLLDYPGCLLVVSHDRYFMDKIVDHLFVFRGEGEIEDFPGNYSDFRAYEDSAEPKVLNSVSTEKTNWKEKQTASTGLSFNEQKEFNKIEREIKDLEIQKKTIEQEFADGKVADDKIEAKANELQKIIQTLEEKEERWFELSSKME